MTKEQAEALAEQIRQQLPLHSVTVIDKIDKRNAPHNWFLAIARNLEDKEALLISSEFEWEQALLAWNILRD